jgi:hypothetical protein
MSQKEDCTHCQHIVEFGARCAVLSDAFPHADRCNRFQRWWHVGGCGFCRHMRGGRCRHPALSHAMDYELARQPGQPCGPSASFWERYGFEGWSADDVATKLGGAR